MRPTPRTPFPRGNPLGQRAWHGARDRRRQDKSRRRTRCASTRSSGGHSEDAHDALISSVHRTNFVSASVQFIVPAPQNLRQPFSPAQDARVATVVFPPPKEITLPSNHLWPQLLPTKEGPSLMLGPHIFRRGLRSHASPADSATSLPLSPFVPARRIITPDSRRALHAKRLSTRSPAMPHSRIRSAEPQTGHDSLAVQIHATHRTNLSGPSPGTPLGFRRVLLRPLSPTTAFGGATAGGSELPLDGAKPLPLVAPCEQGTATSTWQTMPGAGLPTPEAAVVPALASVFDFRVTLLGRITVRSPVGMSGLPTRHTFPTHSRRISPYETRSWGYRSHGDIRGSATSP